MKHTLWASALLFAIAVSEASAQSVMERIRDMFAYNSEAQASDISQVDDTDELVVPEAGLLSLPLSDQRGFRALFAPKPPKPSGFEGLDKVKFFASIHEDSILYSVADTFMSGHEAYRQLKGGVDAVVIGQPMTVYVNSRVVWKIGRHKSLEIKWSGLKSIAYDYAF
jgi:hypothetical protein